MHSACEALRSNNLVLEDCFVPDANLLFRMPDFTTWFTTTPMWGIGFSYTPVYLGVGAAAYRRVCEVVKQRVPRGYGAPRVGRADSVRGSGWHPSECHEHLEAYRRSGIALPIIVPVSERPEDTQHIVDAIRACRP
jgi:hypothetical protein